MQLDIALAVHVDLVFLNGYKTYGVQNKLYVVHWQIEWQNLGVNAF